MNPCQLHIWVSKVGNASRIYCIFPPNLFYLLQNLILTIIAEQLGPDFIAFILDLIENPPDMDLEDQIPDLFVNLILSYNLQFTNTENIVLNALKEKTVAKSFTEKILLLFNREGERQSETKRILHEINRNSSEPVIRYRGSCANIRS